MRKLASTTEPVVAASEMIRLAIAFLAVASLTLVVSACGTDAVGIDECREIEFARCKAAVTCGTIEAEEQEACERFYRDQCLHGLAASIHPGPDQQTACVEAVESAGACAAADKDTSLSGCADGAPARAASGKTLETACDVVARPWDTVECGFLNPSADDDEGMGGAGG